MLAIFGLLVFQQSVFGFLSFTGEGGAVFGRSFLIAGAMMSLIALPLIVGATREALQSIPAPRARGLLRARQGPKASTIRRVLLPAVAARASRTGATLGMGRIAGDTAIVVILLGATLQLEAGGRHRRSSAPCGHRQHAHQLRLQQLAGRRGRRAARRPTRPPSCC